MTASQSRADQGAAPASEQELTAEIERTREDLGATVEALAAKTDIKARIRTAVRRSAVMLRAWTAKTKLQSRAKVENAVLEPVQQAAQQAAATVQRAGATVSKAMPEPVQQAAHKAADTARRRRGPLAIAAGAAIVGSIAIARWRRR
ncbi:MAG TPA: DUF3618 domain-containing protein [Streptosporangiaceae bacterium]